jgi:hypothetical protein
MSRILLDTGPLVAFPAKSSHWTRISAAIAGMGGKSFRCSRPSEMCHVLG